MSIKNKYDFNINGKNWKSEIVASRSDEQETVFAKLILNKHPKNTKWSVIRTCIVYGDTEKMSEQTFCFDIKSVNSFEVKKSGNIVMIGCLIKYSSKKVFESGWIFEI